MAKALAYARGTAQQARRLLGDQARSPHSDWRGLSWAAIRALLEGRLADAEPGMRAALVAGERSGKPNAAEQFMHQLFALCHEQRRFAEFIQIFEAAAVRDPLPVAQTGPALAYIEIDRPDDARREYERLACQGVTDLRQDVFWLPTLATLASVCSALGDRLRAATLGRWEVAAQHFEDALTMNGAMGARPLVAHVQFEYARMRVARSRRRSSPNCVRRHERVSPRPEPPPKSWGWPASSSRSTGCSRSAKRLLLSPSVTPQI
ncbi:MAG: hypothetical protein ACR2PL_23100, partial [Dehalococcoidia bacterium]